MFHAWCSSGTLQYLAVSADTAASDDRLRITMLFIETIGTLNSFRHETSCKSKMLVEI